MALYNPQNRVSPQWRRFATIRRLRRTLHPVVPVLPRISGFLKATWATVDISHMTNHELELFDANPEWRVLLAAYHKRIGDGSLVWSPRITLVEGLASEQVSVIHGKLIALGLLKFEIGSRADGVHYQITPLGRQALLPADERQLAPEWMVDAAPEEDCKLQTAN